MQHRRILSGRLANFIQRRTNLRMFRQLEYAKDSQDPDEHERPALLRGFAIAVRLLNDEYDEERNYRQRVEGVHHRATEVTLRRAADESEPEFDREPRDAHRFDDEERVAVVGLQVVARRQWRLLN